MALKTLGAFALAVLVALVSASPTRVRRQALKYDGKCIIIWIVSVLKVSEFEAVLRGIFS